jgi:hypothetical protein
MLCGIGWRRYRFANPPYELVRAEGENNASRYRKALFRQIRAANPLGQTLIVTAGCGWVGREGGPIEEIRPGDVVWFPPGEKHWHGATPTTAMTHIAIQEALDGKNVDWMEKVSDEQYRR